MSFTSASSDAARQRSAAAPIPTTLRGTRSLAILAALAAAPILATSACPAYRPLLSGYDFSEGQPRNAEYLSTNVIVMADTHAHHLFGDPVFIETNLATAFSSTAIRAPETDLYGHDVLAWLMEQDQNGAPIIHLGDAADASCKDEFESFLKVMGRPPKPGAEKPPWFMAPGNHDGYFYGAGLEAVDTGAWDAACANGPLSGKMTKADFLLRYMKALAAETTDPGLRALAAHRERHPEQELHGELPDNGVEDAMLLGAAWFIDKDDFWRSYMVQRIDLSTPARMRGLPVPPGRRRVIAILLDTSSYDVKPWLLQTIHGADPPNPGYTGHVGADQQKIVERWAKEAHDEGAFLVLMGHHDHASLTTGTRDFFRRLHDDYGAMLYVSAHTHDGRWLAIDAGSTTWPELNLGSVIDDPVEFRRLSIRYTADSRVAIDAQLRRFDTPSLIGTLECDQFRPRWEAKVADPDFYLSYKEMGLYEPQKTQQKILNVMLASYRRLFANLSYTPGPKWPASLPSGEALLAMLDDAVKQPPGGAAESKAKIDLLEELLDAEAGASFTDPPLAGTPPLERFKVCQAHWANGYEMRGAPLPSPTDWTVMYPK